MTVKSYFMDYFRTTYKIHLTRDKNVNFDHNYNKNKITQKIAF